MLVKWDKTRITSGDVVEVVDGGNSNTKRDACRGGAWTRQSQMIGSSGAHHYVGGGGQRIITRVSYRNGLGAGRLRVALV